MKKNKLALALTAAMGLTAAASVQAVNLAENGVGDYAYVPYFSVAKGQLELINIVNTSEKTVAAKIVFRRGTDSTEMRDFIIFLSPKDTWSGYIAPVYKGTEIVNAKLVTSDNSCTVPHKTSWKSEGAGTYSVEFDSNIFGSAVTQVSENVQPNFGSSAIANIKEGYVSIAAMGSSIVGTDAVNSVAYLTKHVNGVPRNCVAPHDALATKNLDGIASVKGQFKSGEEPLRVTAIMVDAKINTAFGVPVTTMANAFATDARVLYPSSTELPTEAEFENKFATYVSAEAKLASGSADKAERSASLALMSDSVYGSYDSTLGSSWVLTFPTKRATMYLKPNVQPFGDSVVQVGSTYYNTEEGVPTTAPVADVTPFSPYVAPVTPNKAIPTLNYEVNVVTFNKINAFGSLLALDAGLEAGFTKGWMQMGFVNAKPVTFGTAGTATGLPVIGFEYFEAGNVAAANGLGLTKNFK